MRVLVYLIGILMIAGCARAPDPVVRLPGIVTEVEVRVPDQEVVLVDWQSAARVAGEDGYFYQNPPASPTKPTAEDIQLQRDVDANNEAYARYVASAPVLQRAQERMIPQLEAELLRAPRAGFESEFHRPVPKINAESGPNLKLVLTPRYGVLDDPGPGQYTSYLEEKNRAGAEVTAGQVAKVILLKVLVGSNTRPVKRSEGIYEISEVETGKVVKSGAYNIIRPPVFERRLEVHARRFWRFVGTGKR